MLNENSTLYKWKTNTHILGMVALKKKQQINKWTETDVVYVSKE